jgi:hypothetical protein
MAASTLRRFAVPLALGGVLALAGCQSLVDVRRVGTAGAPAYDLRGGDLPALQGEADTLCPHGWQPVRQWERHQATPGGDNVLHRSWASTEQALGLAEPDEARLTVQCKG